MLHPLPSSLNCFPPSLHISLTHSLFPSLRSEGDEKILIVDPPSPSPSNFRCVFCANTTVNFQVLCRHQEEEHGLVIRDKANAEASCADLNPNEDAEAVSDNDDNDDDVEAIDDPKIGSSKVLLQRLDVLPSECPLKLEEVGPVCNPAVCSVFRESREAMQRKRKRRGVGGDVDRDGSVGDEDGSVLAEGSGSVVGGGNTITDAAEETTDDRESVKSEAGISQSSCSGKISLTKDKVVYLQRWLFYNQKVSTTAVYDIVIDKRNDTTLCNKVSFSLCLFLFVYDLLSYQDPLPDVDTKRSMSIYTGLTIQQIQLW